MRRTVLLLVAGFALLATPITAEEGLDLDPGKWRVTHTMDNPLGGAAQTGSEVHCWTRADLEPDDLVPAAQGCQVSDVSRSRSKVTWKVQCPAEVGDMSGSGEINAHGSRFDGKVEMSVQVGEETVAFRYDWVGQHVGSCD